MTRSIVVPISNPSAEKVTHTVVVVDAEMAKRWLDKNSKNRPLRQATLQRYRSDMVAGRWMFAGDPIRFDGSGNLIDGQHRLSALVELDISIPFLVVRGLTDTVQGVMDQGAKRTPGDQLALKGIKDAMFVAAAVKVLISWEAGLLFRDAKLIHSITSPAIESWVDENPDDLHFLSSVIGFCKQTDAPPSVVGAVSIAFGRIDQTAATTFLTLLARGAGTEGHPIVTLDKRLQRIRREGLKIPNRDYLALFILAWNAWRKNRQITQFLRPRGGAWSDDNFPQPK